jgi:uncharacterized protein YbaR (Trm112 family)
MSIPTELLRILRDPNDLQPLRLREEGFVNLAAGRKYEIADSIPVLVNPAEVGPQNRNAQ